MSILKLRPILCPLIACIIFLTNYLNLQAQDTTSTTIKRNLIYLDGATFLYIGMASVNYERSLIISKHYKLFACAGFGGWYLYPIPKTYSGFSIPVSVSNVVGSGNNHFEIDLGLRYTFLSYRSVKDRSPYFPVINFGYRYQSPSGKGLIFRSFIGYSGIGIGVGKAF